MDAEVYHVRLRDIDQSQFPVFLQDWWVAATRAALTTPFREALVVEDGYTLGYLAYAMQKSRLGNPSWKPPNWSRVNEPIIRQTLPRDERAAVIKQLIGQLPRNISFEFVCGPSAADLDLIGEAAHAAGFSQREETIFWQLPEDSKTLMQRVSKRTRQSIMKARDELTFVDFSPEQFIRLYDANLRAAGRKPYSDSHVAKALITAGLKRPDPQARIFAVRKKSADPDDDFIDAAIACVWDYQRYYYWMTTCSRFSDDASQQKPHGHAIKLLVVTAIEDAGARGLIFDTDSGDTESACRQFQSLRFENRAQRIVFTRHTLPLRLYRGVRPLLKRIAAYLGYKHII
jgi:hypothetical protein